MATVGSAVGDARYLVAKRVVSAYNQLDLRMVFRPPSGVSPWLQPHHVAEASALSQQLQEISISFGDDTANWFIRTMFERHPKVALGWEIASSALSRAGVDGRLSRLQTVFAWSLLGNSAAEGVERANPVYRLTELCLDIPRFGWPQAESVRGVFDKWDERLDRPGTIAGVVRWR